MAAAAVLGLSLSRKQRRTFHQLRLRRESYGELVQIDGSQHRWFEQRAESCTLLVFIGDATSRLMQLRFVSSESMSSYFEVLEDYLENHGFPDRPLEVRWKGVSLPCRISEKDRRVKFHAATVEDKWLGQVLALVKLQQELRQETKLKTNSEKTGHQKRPRQLCGSNSV